ncbi:MAG: glycoside hydrolase family 16 protein [Armatimonadetes bacterium]|nr:glycoside hydrolase family 16 protein [Armatimonadota bacterium]MDE2205007.1 glycoside hydrolase family 16 protein [Armatimonadota bacterium]
MIQLLLVLLARPPALQVAAAVPKEPGYHLIWHDEFSGNGLPDPKKWGWEVGMLRNHEAEYYTKDRLANARVENGHLTITGIHEPYKGAQFTSASLQTHDTFSFEYGRLEVRAKLPGGSGTWPAIWLMGEDVGQTGWPRCGELDVMEHVAFDAAGIHGTVHLPHPDGQGQASAGGTVQAPDCTTAWHVYGMNWSPQAISFSLDGKPYFRYPYSGPQSWVFDKPMYLIINLAIGGDWGGQHGLDPAAYPQKFQIDYVRVWQKDRPGRP